MIVEYKKIKIRTVVGSFGNMEFEEYLLSSLISQVNLGEKQTKQKKNTEKKIHLQCQDLLV